MKKILLSVLAGGILIVLLSGCASMEERLNRRIEQKATEEALLAKLDDAEVQNGYAQLADYVNAGMLSENGELLAGGLQGEITQAAPDGLSESHEGEICVSFAENSRLDVRYYPDAYSETPFPSDEVLWIEPGQKIYAEVQPSAQAFQDVYDFKEVYLLDAAHQRIAGEHWVKDESTGRIVISIPDVTKQSGMVTVMPVGAYQSRTLTLDDRYTDTNGNTYPMSGTWTVNGKETIDKECLLDPTVDYSVSYSYDSDNYFFDSSSPKEFFQSEQDGRVIFPKQKIADTPCTEFTITLKEYEKYSVITKIDRSLEYEVRYQNEEMNAASGQCDLKAGAPMEFPRLRPGATILVTTDSEWSELAEAEGLVLESGPVLSFDGKVTYQLQVPQPEDSFVITANEFDKYKQTEKGALQFTYAGKPVTGDITVYKGQKIYFSLVKGVDKDNDGMDDYWLGKDPYVDVTSESDTKNALSNITWYETKNIELTLLQPEEGGAIRYRNNGTELTGTLQTREGEALELELVPWSGWKLTDGSYDLKMWAVVCGNGTINWERDADPVDVNCLFEEDDAHKPKLKIILDNSVDGLAFHVHSGKTVLKEDGKYDGKHQRPYALLDESIGTGPNELREIRMSGKAIQAGTAVQVKIRKEYEDLTLSGRQQGGREEYTEYFTELPTTFSVPIYEDGTAATSTRTYKNVEVTISIVEGMQRFQVPEMSEHTVLEVRRQENLEIVEYQEDQQLWLKKSEKLYITIRPDDPEYYYITDPDKDDDQWTDTMTFEKYLEKMYELADKHKAVPKYEITLGTPDAFATYEYFLDGKPVSGTIRARDGQRLELTYTLTDKRYYIPFAVGLQKSSTTEHINLKAEHNGKTLTQKDFGITVKTKKGE